MNPRPLIYHRLLLPLVASWVTACAGDEFGASVASGDAIEAPERASTGPALLAPTLPTNAGAGPAQASNQVPGTAPSGGGGTSGNETTPTASAGEAGTTGSEANAPADGSGGSTLDTDTTGGVGGAGGESPTQEAPPPPEEPPIEPCAPTDATETLLEFCPEGPFEALPLIEGEEEEILCTDEVNWSEGPIWSAADSTLYFSNFDERDDAGFYDGSIMTWREGEGCVEFLPNVGTNGLAFGVDGRLIAGRQTNRTLSRVDLATGEVCSLVDTFEGKRLSSPNDVAVRADGNIYFTDPAWNLGERTEELPQSLYRIDPDGNLSLIDVFDELRPNGVNLSPDGRLLYVAIIETILVYDVDEDGLVDNPRDFVIGPTVDGMALDCAGNVYASTGYVYSPQGEQIGEFWGGTNLAFGGPDGKTLFISGHGRLTSRRVNVPGMPY